jgi:hypothetical protein
MKFTLIFSIVIFSCCINDIFSKDSQEYNHNYNYCKYLNNCKNNGKCINAPNTKKLYYCSCLNGYSGFNCEISI